ncbi:excalibur calcium-binding domain-containing protein [Metabacillus sp. 22489]|uniref:excalibur calcium-binding domain-containing protein n=1 Tax=Metabacillus sp. 22489 TaxID=3453928 RepID=UPI003F863721
MQKWIGKRPTMSQKALVSKYEKLLLQAQDTILNPTEKILKAIETECDKKSGRELDGVLVLTTESVVFISKSENMVYKYSQINDIDVQSDGKDKNEWQITLQIGRSRRTFDDIKKNDDSQEFVEILEHMITNKAQEILTTVTHDFDYFLHAETLEDLRKREIKITSFLLKRDDMGHTKNGERLLREKHKGAELIIEGFYQDTQKKGNFIVVDTNILLYEYDNKERKAKLINTWSYNFFANAVIDYFAIKTVISNDEGKLVLNSSGKAFVNILSKGNIPFKYKKRKWYQKILGFRSGKWWKRTIASLFYLFILLIIIGITFGEDSTEKASIKSTTEVTDSETEEVEEEARLAEEKRKQEEEARLAEEKRKQEEEARLAEEKRKQEEEARLAEEKRKQEEEARLAEEKRKQEEEARLAEEKRKQEEEARLAEEKRKQEEEARLAEEKRKQEEEARLAEEKRKQEDVQMAEIQKQEQQTNVYYKNCTQAKAAGAAPIHKGEPGYAKHLDRDGDGIGCDR